METQHKRSAFSGKLGFVLSAAGASVGLGNIWRFPYLAAKYGGGIFLLIYILLAVTFGYTMIIAETALGRMTRKSPVGAYSHFGKGKGLAFGGWINAVIPILIVPYYSVIGGWVIHYLAQYLTGHGSALASDGYFSGFISNGLLAEIAFLLFTFITLGIIFAGVRTGIESADVQLLEMAQVFRLPLARRVKAIWLPAILPAFRQGCSVALGICWKSGVAAEVIGLPDGSIGDALYRAKITLSTGELFAWTFVIILLSAGFEKLFLALLDKAVARVLGEDVTKND